MLNELIVTLDIDKLGGDKFFTDHMMKEFNAVGLCNADGDLSRCFSSEIKDIPFKPNKAVILSDGSANVDGIKGNNMMLCS